MAGPTLKVNRDDDGGVSLVTEVDGIVVAFATVNPSQLHEAALAQGKPAPKLPSDDDNGNGE